MSNSKKNNPRSNKNFKKNALKGISMAATIATGLGVTGAMANSYKAEAKSSITMTSGGRRPQMSNTQMSNFTGIKGPTTTPVKGPLVKPPSSTPKTTVTPDLTPSSPTLPGPSKGLTPGVKPKGYTGTRYTVNVDKTQLSSGIRVREKAPTPPQNVHQFIQSRNNK